MNRESAEYADTVPSGRILVDGLGIGDVGNVVLRDRQHLSQDGLIVVVLTLEGATGEVVAGPDVITRGFIYVKSSEQFLIDIKNMAKKIFKKQLEKNVVDFAAFKNKIKKTNKIIKDNLKKLSICNSNEKEIEKSKKKKKIKNKF